MARDKCVICQSKEDIDDIGWLWCNHCKKWNHASCTNVKSIEEFKVLKLKKFWFCPACFTESNFESAVLQSAKNVVSNVSSSVANVSDDELSNLVKNEMKRLWPNIVHQMKKEINAEIDPKISNLEQKICDLEKIVNSMQRKSDRTESRNMKKNILVQGVPDSFDIDNHSFIMKIADEIGFNKLAIFDIDSTVRFKNNGRRAMQNKQVSSLILVSFTSQSVKEMFMKSYYVYLKSSKLCLSCIDPVYEKGFIFINNQLDKKTHQIFMRAQELKKEGKIHKVFIKKKQVNIVKQVSSMPTIITSIDDLLEFNAPVIDMTHQTSSSGGKISEEMETND